MTHVRPFVRPLVRPLVRSGAVGPYGGATYQDGIHLNFASGSSSVGQYVKAPGAAPTVAALTSLFTFTCGNQSMYMGPNGLLVQAVTNVPRIEYDANGNCLGLLMEASRTNLALHSDDHTNAAWVKTNMTTAKTSTGPDGVANSATRLTATAGNATSLQTVTSASATRDYSVWLRRVTGTGNIDMTLDNGVGWTTRPLTTSWQRFDITQAAVTNPVFGIRIVTSGDAIDVYGNQMESAAFASSLIPTTTVAVTRTADSCTRTLGSEFSATAGTVVVRGRASGGQDATTAQATWSLDDGIGNEIYRLIRPAASDLARFSLIDGGVPQATLDFTATNSANFKHASAWAVNDIAATLNGAAVLTDAVATLATPTALNIGSTVAGTLVGNCHILRFDYWPERRSNAFLQQASA